MIKQISNHRRAKTLVLAALFTHAIPVLAADALPGAIDPGQIEKRFERPPEPRATHRAIIPETKAPLPPEEAGQIRFQLTAIEIEGSTVFTAAELREHYAEYLGHEISLLDIYQVAARITARYGNAGYILGRVIVPAQQVTDGIVRLRAIEGYIDRVQIEGKLQGLESFFDYYAEKIKASRPLHNSVLERYLLLANDLHGVKVQSVLRPSTDNTGAATLVLTVGHEPYAAAVSLDNRGSESVGPWQAMIEGTANGLIGGANRTSARLATNPATISELGYFAFTHTRVLNGEGASLDFSLTKSGSEPGGEAMRQLEVKTDSLSLGATYAYPLRRARTGNTTLSGGFILRNSDTRQLGEKTSEDALRIAQLGYTCDNADATGINLFSVTLNKGLDTGGAKVGSRADASPGFTALNLHASRTQRLAENWSATLRAGIQLANGTLPASEQFGIGGETFGRAYNPSEWIGDKGIGVSLEVTRNTRLSETLEIQSYAFLDAAKVLRNNPVDEPESQSAKSAGFGARVTRTGISLAIEAAKPLDDRAAASEGRDWRLFARTTARF